MTTTIALAGKGGVGKTTIAGLIMKFFIHSGIGPILAVDADPSSNLNMVLGIVLDKTVGDIREDLLSQVKSSLLISGAAMGSLPGGTSKRDYLDYHIRASLIESNEFDLIAMGRSEGQGCYCAVNHNLRDILDKISQNYQYVIIDNEAGMEHLNRRTTRDVQHLIIISDSSQRGITAAERISEYRKQMDIHIENTYLVLNRVNGEVPYEINQKIKGMEIPYSGIVPGNSELTVTENSGKSILQISENNLAYKSVVAIMKSILRT